MTDCIMVITTVAKQEDADRLARLVLEKRMVACVQISSCTSLYHWQGDIEQDHELKLVMKTSAELYPELEQCIGEAHPYDTPEILATPIRFCSPDYLAWMRSELIKKSESQTNEHS